VHVWNSFVRTRQQSEVEASVVVQVANNPGALACDLDGDGAIRKSTILQAWSVVKFQGVCEWNSWLKLFCLCSSINTTTSIKQHHYALHNLDIPLKKNMVRHE
jgi:hypothetical protein